MSEGNIKVREVTQEMIKIIAEHGISVLCMMTDIEDATFKDGNEEYIYEGKKVMLNKAREIVYRK